MAGNRSGYVLRPDEGEGWWFAGAWVAVKAAGAAEGCSPSVLEQVVPPVYSTPVHVHRHEDEAWYVIEGELEFDCGGTVLTARPGDFVFAPRAVPHVLLNRLSVPARMLIITPPGFGRFVQAAGERVAPGVGPATPGVVPPAVDPARLAAVAVEHGIDIVGPPPLLPGGR